MDKVKCMLSEKDVTMIYETLLSSPGMGDIVKLDLKLPRKNVLLLVKLIERGMNVTKGEATDPLLQVCGENALQELQRISSDVLVKVGLQEMSEKMKELQAK